MKITFERSGGVGGFRLSAEVDTDSKQLIFGATRSAKTLSADEVRDLEKIVKAADFFSLPDVSSPRGKSSDPFQYVITIESGRQRRTIRTTDQSMPLALEPLVNKLVSMSKGRSK